MGEEEEGGVEGVLEVEEEVSVEGVEEALVGEEEVGVLVEEGEVGLAEVEEEGVGLEVVEGGEEKVLKVGTVLVKLLVCYIKFFT